jgi:hypothetical protein
MSLSDFGEGPSGADFLELNMELASKGGFQKLATVPKTPAKPLLMRTSVPSASVRPARYFGHSADDL